MNNRRIKGDRTERGTAKHNFKHQHKFNPYNMTMIQSIIEDAQQVKHEVTTQVLGSSIIGEAQKLGRYDNQ